MFHKNRLEQDGAEPVQCQHCHCFLGGCKSPGVPRSRLHLLFLLSDSLLMWCSCLRQQGQDKKHEDDKDRKTNPKSNHNGIWWEKRKRKQDDQYFTYTCKKLPSTCSVSANPKQFAACFWVTKRKDNQIYLFLNRRLPLKISF